MARALGRTERACVPAEIFVLQVKCQIELPRQAVTLQTALEVETMNTGLVLNAEVRKLRQRGSLGEQS